MHLRAHGDVPRCRITSPRGAQDGQSVVEFALILPLLLIVLLAVVDFARIYTTMLSVESAAREAADYGTTLGAGRWQPGSPMDATVSEMRRRACVAARNLPDYTGPDDACTNPSFAYCLTPSIGGACGPVDPVAACDDPERDPPCSVTVTLTYVFHLLAPLNIELMGVHLGFPSTLTFSRDSTFAMTDIALATPAPGP
jgi:Flp pilus assembly protein TadG